MFRATVGNVPIPAEHAEFLNKLLLAQHMGWSFSDIESMDISDYERVLVVLDAMDRAKTPKEL